MREVLSVIREWLISMLQPPPLSPNRGNKQAETVEGSIDVCSFMRTYHSRPTYGQKRSNEILSYQIEFFAWLVSFRDRCCAHTQRISKHFQLSIYLGGWRWSPHNNTSLIKIFQKKIFDTWDWAQSLYVSGRSNKQDVFLSPGKKWVWNHSFTHSLLPI